MKEINSVKENINKKKMPAKKINFTVVHVSGEDELHPAMELNSEKQVPMNQGWNSQKLIWQNIYFYNYDNNYYFYLFYE